MLVLTNVGHSTVTATPLSRPEGATDVLVGLGYGAGLLVERRIDGRQTLEERLPRDLGIAVQAIAAEARSLARPVSLEISSASRVSAKPGSSRCTTTRSTILCYGVGCRP